MVDEKRVLVMRDPVTGKIRPLTAEELKTFVPANEEARQIAQEQARTLPDSFFKTLNPEEEKQFVDWAHEHFEVDTPPNNLWHPVVRREWAMLQEKAEQLKKEGYPGGKPFTG